MKASDPYRKRATQEEDDEIDFEALEAENKEEERAPVAAAATYMQEMAAENERARQETFAAAAARQEAGTSDASQGGYNNFLKAVQWMNTIIEKFSIDSRSSYDRLDQQCDTMHHSVGEVRRGVDELREHVNNNRREAQQTRYKAQQYYQHALITGLPYQPPPYGLFDPSFFEEIHHPPPPPPPQD